MDVSSLEKSSHYGGWVSSDGPGVFYCLILRWCAGWWLYPRVLMGAFAAAPLL